MSQVTINLRAGRAAEARLARRVRWAAGPLTWALAVLCFGLGAFLLLQKVSVGWGLWGYALIAVMFQLWNTWRLQQIPAEGSLENDPVRLELVLEDRLLGQLHGNPHIADIWDAAGQTWEGAFVSNRLSIPHDVAGDFIRKSYNDDALGLVVEFAKKLGIKEIDGGVVIAALLSQPEFKDVLVQIKFDENDVIQVLQWQQRVKRAIESLKQKPVFGGIGRDWASGYTPVLNQYAKNLTKEVEQGYYRHLPQVHENTIDQLEQLLAGGRGAVALVGDVGSGKTSIMYSMAERLLNGRGGPALKYNYVMQLNASLILSSGQKIENIVLQLLSEALHAQNIIIFLDDAQMFFQSGTGSVDLSQMLLPVLQQSNIKLVMAMSTQDWQGISARTPSLLSQLQRITVPPPSQEDTARIIEDAAMGIEHRAGATVMYDATREAYKMADRYMTETAFPGKGITLLDAAARRAQGGLVTAESVRLAVEAMIGTKVATASAAEASQLLNLEDEIHRRMVNQSRAVTVVANALRRARAGVRNPSRPVGSFMFLGPTGVGKTELARALADIYFGGEDKIVRIDMSEYQQPSDVDRLLSPRSNAAAGSTLTSSIRQQPFSVVLFDEIEKAHPDILNLMLQLLDEGRLTDTEGRTASFKDAIVICTSNAAADVIRQHVASGQPLESFEDEVVSGLIAGHQFRPELLNRFDEIVLFTPLAKPELRQVVTLMIGGVNKTLAAQKISIELTDAAIDLLVERGYDPNFGARPMRRMVQRTVEDTVARRILAGSAAAGAHIVLDAPDLAPAPATPTAQ